MTIYDLMLNDLVLYKGHVKKVVGIKRSYNLIDLAINDKDYFTCSVTDIEPIELTPEILKAKGFVLDEEYQEWYKDGIPFNVMLGCDSDRECGWTCSEMTHREPLLLIKHMHILQHALRLCGLNDLVESK